MWVENNSLIIAMRWMAISGQMVQTPHLRSWIALLSILVKAPQQVFIVAAGAIADPAVFPGRAISWPSCLRSRAAWSAPRTDAVEKELMPRCAKSPGKLRFRLGNAPLNVKELATAIAMKMMVMLLPRNLVACCIAGKFDWLQPRLLDQALNISIDRGNSKSGIVALRAL